MTATDQRTNMKSATAPVTIRITRDEAPPEFIGNPPYSVSVSENVAVNDSVALITARVDSDQVACVM